MKAFTFKEPETLEDKSSKRELEALLLEQIKFIVKEKEKLAINNRRQYEESNQIDGNSWKV